MNKETTTYKALKFIYVAGQVRENDISLYIRNRYKDFNNVRKAINSLLTHGFIQRKTYSLSKAYHKGDTDKVFYATPKGRGVVIDTEQDDYYRQCYKSSIRKFYVKTDKNHNIETDRIDKLLSDNGIMAMFATNDIPVFQHDKPSLEYLRTNLLGMNVIRKDGYLDYLTLDECKSFLDKGIYYTEPELLEYANTLSQSITDTIVGTRIRGIFISTYNCFAVYASRKFDNKILRVNIKGEKGLINAFRSFEDFTRIYRAIPAFDKYEYSVGMGTSYVSSFYHNKPFALIISDGEMLAYATATGNARGMVKSVDRAIFTERLESGFTARPNGDSSSKASTYLTAASNLYEKIYVVPSNINGIYALSYLLSHSLEEFREDAIKILASHKCFEYDSSMLDPFPYNEISTGEKYPVLYMPVFEAKALYSISKSDDNPVIITYADLLNMISHSIRKEGRFFDAYERQFFGRDNVLIYDDSGHIAGESILDGYLKQKGLTYNKKTERFILPQKMCMGHVEFYNAMARGELDLDKVISVIQTKPYIPPIKHRFDSKRVTVSMPSGLLSDIKIAAKEEGISVSKYVSKQLKKGDRI